MLFCGAGRRSEGRAPPCPLAEALTARPSGGGLRLGPLWVCVCVHRLTPMGSISSLYVHLE